MSAALCIKSEVRCFNGRLIRAVHESTSTSTPMTFTVYLPPSRELEGQSLIKQFPVILYLSGLTCTDENVCQKSGVFQYLSELGIGFIAPDTSPRGLNIPGDSDSWDFGVGAGFYVDAIQAPWSDNYKMYSYISSELLHVVRINFVELNMDKLSVMGHSMGGHGALVIALKNQGLFSSVSAFAPICNPTQCPWGRKAFTGFLGSIEAGIQYDATEIIKLGKSKFSDILIDVGTSDSFANAGQLLCENFHSTCLSVDQPVTLRQQEGYDHGYYFVSSFIEEHVRFHAKYLF